MYFGCFFFNAHGYKYITLNADLSEYIIIFTSHLFICVRIRGFIKFVSRWWKLKVGGGALRAGMGH